MINYNYIIELRANNVPWGTLSVPSYPKPSPHLRKPFILYTHNVPQKVGYYSSKGSVHQFQNKDKS